MAGVKDDPFIENSQNTTEKPLILLKNEVKFLFLPLNFGELAVLGINAGQIFDLGIELRC